MGFDDARFGGLCTNLVGMNPLPLLGEAYSQVICEEQRLSSARAREQVRDAVGFVTRRETYEQMSSSVKDAPTNSVAYLGRSDNQGLTSCLVRKILVMLFLIQELHII